MAIKKSLIYLGFATSIAFYAAGFSAQEIFHNGKMTGDFRLRYEQVDTHIATINDATGLTLRSRLGYETGASNGISAMLEFEDTRVVGGLDNFTPIKPDYADILDPEQTEVNQAHFHFKNLSSVDVKLGRQRISLDNERFIGIAGFRQNEQTFDAISESYSGINQWTFYYAYIDSVQGIANLSPLFNFSFDSEDHLLNIAYTCFAAGKIIAFAYQLKNQEKIWQV